MSAGEGLREMAEDFKHYFAPDEMALMLAAAEVCDRAEQQVRIEAMMDGDNRTEDELAVALARLKAVSP